MNIKANMHKLILIIIMLIPFYVNAEEKCNHNDVIVESINIKEKSTNTEEVAVANITNNKININLKMYDVNDYIEYILVLKNTSNKDYDLNKDFLNLKKEFINYELKSNNDSNIIKANEIKTLYLKITYNNEVQSTTLSNGIYNDNKLMTINLFSEKDNILINPQTGFGLQLIIIITIMSISIFSTICFRKKTNFTMLIFLISLFILIPIKVYALCQCSVQIDSKIQIDERDALFDIGTNVNIKMKNLAGDDTTTNAANTEDNNIKAIKYSETEPTSNNKEEKNIVSSTDSEYPIYMWYENNNINWWSEAYHPKLNEDASNMFRQLIELTDIRGLSQIDIIQVKNLNNIFLYDSSMYDYNNISKWNSSNVISMQGSFAYNNQLQNIEFLENWNTSKVTNMRQMFQGSSRINSLEPLKKWDVSNVTTMRSMFAGLQELKTLKGLEKWDTSNVISMYGIFMGNREYNYKMKIEDITALKNWNVSNVKEMQGMFQSNFLLNDLAPLSNWDTSNVVNLQNMFTDDYSLTNLNGLEKWNLSKVTNISKMFLNCISLEDVSAISNWDVSNVEIMDKLFYINYEVATSENKHSELSNLDIRKWNTSKVKNFDYFINGLEYINTEFTIRSNVETYKDMLKNAATKSGKVTINYTADTETIVNNMIATKSDNANIVKGTLVE